MTGQIPISPLQLDLATAVLRMAQIHELGPGSPEGGLLVDRLIEFDLIRLRGHLDAAGRALIEAADGDGPLPVRIDPDADAPARPAEPSPVAGTLHSGPDGTPVVTEGAQAATAPLDALAAIERIRALHTEQPIYEHCGHTEDDHGPDTPVVRIDDAEGQPTESCKVEPVYSVCGHCCAPDGDLTTDHQECHDASDCWPCPTLRALEPPAATRRERPAATPGASVPRLLVATFGQHLAIRATGREIAMAAVRLLVDADRIALDFSGVVAVTPTCADALVAELDEQVGQVPGAITAEGMADDVTSVFREVFERRGVEGWQL